MEQCVFWRQTSIHNFNMFLVTYRNTYRLCESPSCPPGPCADGFDIARILHSDCQMLLMHPIIPIGTDGWKMIGDVSRIGARLGTPPPSNSQYVDRRIKHWLTSFHPHTRLSTCGGCRARHRDGQLETDGGLWETQW